MSVTSEAKLLMERRQKLKDDISSTVSFAVFQLQNSHPALYTKLGEREAELREVERILKELNRITAASREEK